MLLHVSHVQQLESGLGVLTLSLDMMRFILCVVYFNLKQNLTAKQHFTLNVRIELFVLLFPFPFLLNSSVQMS